MSAKDIILLGTGVFAEEFLDVIDACPEFRVVGFAENLDRSLVPGPLMDLPVHWVDDLPKQSAGCSVVCAIGTTKRSQFTDQVEALGVPFASVVHPTAQLSKASSLGPGSVLSVGNIVASHTTIGRHVIVNRGCLIGHHTTIGDFVTISPGSNIGGRVRIADRCYIGMGATILNDLSVGEGSIVGAGAVVTKDVPAGVQVLGVPARITKEGVDPR